MCGKVDLKVAGIRFELGSRRFLPIVFGSSRVRRRVGALWRVIDGWVQGECLFDTLAACGLGTSPTAQRNVAHVFRVQRRGIQDSAGDVGLGLFSRR